VSALTHDSDVELWRKFKETHNKFYTKQEEVKRFNIFKKNLKLINTHNLAAKVGIISTTMQLGVTKFADMTNEEFRAERNGFRGAAQGRSKAHFEHRVRSDVNALPASVDWRTKNLVTPVKDQGQCGSCWAFSAVASLEGQHAKSSGKLVSLSEQNLVDCSTKEGNQGCNGGLMDDAFQYVKDAGGIDTETSYPYEGKDDTCKFNKANVGATLKSWVDVKSGDEAALADAAANVGPIAVAIDASSIWFQLYFGGVYDHTDCGNKPENLDHGVTVVGYGTDNGTDYWLIKNSWGDSFWGEKGYLRLKRNANNLCGVATQASYPQV